MRSARTRLQAAPPQGAASKDTKPGSRHRLTDNPVGPGCSPPASLRIMARPSLAPAAPPPPSAAYKTHAGPCPAQSSTPRRGRATPATPRRDPAVQPSLSTQPLRVLPPAPGAARTTGAIPTPVASVGAAAKRAGPAVTKPRPHRRRLRLLWPSTYLRAAGPAPSAPSPPEPWAPSESLRARRSLPAQTAGAARPAVS